jgi:CMP-N-acetylneuraminic acid synthetase
MIPTVTGDDPVYESPGPDLHVLGLVPARGGSQRLPSKNLAELGGKTLVRRTLETAVACPKLARVALSSDDGEILAESSGLEGVLSIERPAELATDTSTAYEAVVHALQRAETETGELFDAVALIQCTSPFTEPDDITGAVELLERSGADSVVSVFQAEHDLHPLKMKRMEGDQLLPLFEDNRLTPARDLTEVWARNGSIYVSRRETIVAGDLVGDDIRGYVMPRERSIDIDTRFDLELAEFLFQRRAADGARPQSD